MKLNRKQVNQINRTIDNLGKIREIANSLGQLEDGYGQRLDEALSVVSVRNFPVKNNSLIRKIREMNRAATALETGLYDVEYIAGELEEELGNILDEMDRKR